MPPVAAEPAVPTGEVAAALAGIERDGYAVVEAVLAPTRCDELIADLARLERERSIVPAGNPFEGHATWRIYNLLSSGRLYEALVLDPRVLAVVEGVLDPGCLLSSLSSIAIGPGERAQPIHADDQLIPLPKPHPAVVCNTMWALTDFTETNGATRLVPGSHRADHSPPYGSTHASVAAVMARGSVLVWHGSLWHGGGANSSGARRWGVAANFCAGWVRQQENQQLGLPLDTVATFPPRLRELCGFGIYRGLLGHIDKRSPADVLLGDRPPPAAAMVWDAARPPGNPAARSPGGHLPG